MSILIKETYPFSPPKLKLYKIVATNTCNNSTNSIIPAERASSIVETVNKIVTESWVPCKTVFSALIQIDERVETWEQANEADPSETKDNSSFSEHDQVCCIFLSLHIFVCFG